MRFLLIAALLVGAAFVCVPRAGAWERHVIVTTYLPTGDVTYSGHWPAWGTAACSWDMPLGTRLRFADGFEVECWDRGLLGWDGWIDVYAPDWTTAAWVWRQYGPAAVVTVTRWGWGP